MSAFCYARTAAAVLRQCTAVSFGGAWAGERQEGARPLVGKLLCMLDDFRFLAEAFHDESIR